MLINLGESSPYSFEEVMYMMFSKEDFSNPDVAEQIRLVLMDKLGYPLMTSFLHLTEEKKREFNVAMNEYIQEFPDDWQPVLNEDFSNICRQKIFTPDFQEETFAAREEEAVLQVESSFPERPALKRNASL
jgi:hypothetical protein